MDAIIIRLIVALAVNRCDNPTFKTLSIQLTTSMVSELVPEKFGILYNLMLAILSTSPQLTGTFVNGCNSVEILSQFLVALLAATIGLK